MLKALFMSFILPVSVSVFAGIFGPSSFEDCILDGVKSAKSQAAVDAIKQACAIKFSDTRETKSEKNTRESKEALIRKCGLTAPQDYDGSIYISNDYKNRLGLIISNIKGGEFAPESPVSGVKWFPFKFQNNNQFGISGLMIGFTGDKSCPSDMSKFKATFYCGYPNPDVGVSAQSYGKVFCPNEAEKFLRSSGSCVIGVRPIIDRFNVGMAKFMDSNNLCN